MGKRSFLPRTKSKRVDYILDEVTQKYFQEVLAVFLIMNPKGDFLLANEFEIAVSTVHRWLSGVSNPHPGRRKQVVRWINNAGVM